MRRVMLGAAAILLVAGPVHAKTAPDPARLAAARQVVELSRVRDFSGQMMDQMVAQLMQRTMRDAAKADGITAPADRARFDRATAVVSDEMRAQLQANLPKLIDAQAEIYADVFTLSELRGLADFYRSPTGQAMITKMPALAQATTAKSYDILVKPMMARMPAIMAKMQAELAKPAN